MKISILLIVFNLSFFQISKVFSQDTTVFRQINTEVWDKFEKAFRTNDAALFNSLQAKDVLRIPADSKTILSGHEYLDSQIKSFQWVKENGFKTEMELRFIERINFGSDASEKGIFKFTVTEPDSTHRYYYGKFHVLLKQQADKTWKITMNYDSSEKGTVDENDFKEAYDEWNFTPFLN